VTTQRKSIVRQALAGSSQVWKPIGDAQTKTCDSDGGGPSLFPERRAGGTYLPSGARFVTTEEDMRRLGTRIPLRRIFSLRHASAARK
jgi:hypothetical protein